jgi:hypothetical protein
MLLEIAPGLTMKKRGRAQQAAVERGGTLQKREAEVAASRQPDGFEDATPKWSSRCYSGVAIAAPLL